MVKTKADLTANKRGRGVLTLAKPSTRPPVVASAADKGNIKVVVRVRPLNERERGGERCRNVINIIDKQMLVFDPKDDDTPFFFHGQLQKHRRDISKKSNKDMQFLFDHVFPSTLSNEEVFKNSTYTLIDALMDGFNCSVFAYGATGAGKTFTMLGSPESPGITFLTMAELFKRKDELSAQREFDLGISYLEVYNETVQDLLKPGVPLHLREDSKYGVMVSGIKIHRIQSPDELFQLLETGNRNRTQHPTDANAESSRSHAVFQVYLHMTIKVSRQVRTAKLSMIDLAGSERASATGCVGARFAEGANINKSLLALGNCINSLADGNKHIPYRDSKLTRLLKDSLGGNCQTIMIANVSPSALTYEDTYNTLKYAMRAKKIKSHIKRNVVNPQMHIGQYVKIVEELQEEIKQLKKRLADSEKQKTVVVPTEEIHPTSPESLDTLQEYFKEKQKLANRQHQIEMQDIGLTFRKKSKEEADARVSVHCTDTPEKEEAHKKLGDAVERFQNRSCALQQELIEVQKQRLQLDCNINALVTANAQLKPIVEAQNKKIFDIEQKHRLELVNKQLELTQEDSLIKDKLLEQMSKPVKHWYLIIKGHGFATEAITNEYKSISKKLEDVKCIKWGELCFDSGLSSSSTTTLASEESDLPVVDEAIATSEPLNCTFTLGHSPRVIVQQDGPRTTNVVRKSPYKRKMKRVEPLKENKQPFRRPLTALVGNKGIATAKVDVKTMTGKSTLSRPPFKR